MRASRSCPYFEGWIKNPDGTFDMVFGYFNRNFVQEFAIPAGPDNSIEPFGPDGGQPTYFLPRRQRYMFRVKVPADFGKKELVWTITPTAGPSARYGNLMPAAGDHRARGDDQRQLRSRATTIRTSRPRSPWRRRRR